MNQKMERVGCHLPRKAAVWTALETTKTPTRTA